MVESSIEETCLTTGSRPGPVRSYMETFAEVLQREGYSAGRIDRYLRAAKSLSDWLQHRGTVEGIISEAIVEDYVTSLGRRPCATRSKGRVPDAGFAARKFVRVLCEQGSVARHPVPAPAHSPADEWLVPFTAHLGQVAGLSEGTCGI